jgi:hypothetical protein
MMTQLSKLALMTCLLAACAETPPPPPTCDWALSTPGALYVCATPPLRSDAFLSCRDRSGSVIMVRESSVLTIQQTCR